jgi:hypothetical protein
VSGKTRGPVAKDLRQIDPELFPPENLIERKTTGTGNGNTKLVSFKNAILLIMALPGKIARETRVHFADIIRTHLANSIANDPVNENQNFQETGKRSMECDGGFYGDNLDVDERKARIGLMVADAHLKTAKVHKELLESYVSICNHVDLDDEAKATFKASVLNIVRPVAALSKYKAAPDQREQQVATGKIRVNSYTNRDIDLMQVAITAFAEQGAPAVGRPSAGAPERRWSQSRICFAPVAGPV